MKAILSGNSTGKRKKKERVMNNESKKFTFFLILEVRNVRLFIMYGIPMAWVRLRALSLSIY